MKLSVFSFDPSGQNMMCSLCEMFFFSFIFFLNLPYYWIEAQKKEDSVGSVNAAWWAIIEFLKSQKFHKTLLNEFHHLTENGFLFFTPLKLLQAVGKERSSFHKKFS